MTIQLDKQAHALSGAVLVLLPVIASRQIWWGLLICFVAAIAKESYDYCNPKTHTCDFWDAIATCAGGALATLFVLVVS